MMNLTLSLHNRKMIVDRIEDFYILCVYQHNYSKDQYSFLKKRYDQSKVIELPEVNQTLSAKSFIVWAKNYEQNESLFYNIRMHARQETVVEISKALTSYYIEQHPFIEKKLNNPLILDELLYTLQLLIRQTEFLSDEQWLQFYYALTNELKDYIIDEILQKLSLIEVQKMEDEQFNYLFFDFISSQLEKKGPFNQFIVDSTNRYLSHWVTQIIKELSESGKLDQAFNPLMEERSKRGEFAQHFTVENHLYVMNNLPYQIIREAIYKNNFVPSHYSPFPTATIMKGNTEGQIEINPIIGVQPIQYAWEQVEKISDIDVDVFDALCNFYLSKKRQSNEVVQISVSDLLNYRGLKPKRSGEGRRGGYDAKQKQQIMQSLSNIQSIRLNLTKLLSFEKSRPKYTKLAGRTFLFKNNIGQDTVIYPDEVVKTIYFTLDEAFATYLSGTGRQIALQHMRALQYHPTQQLYEKRLCRYLSWRWRTQARKGDYITPNSMQTMLDSIGITMNERLPSRTRERFERALDQLQIDGVIQSWQYDKWDEAIAEYKGWGRVWLSTGVIIEPPKSIIKQYAKIEKRTSKKVVEIVSLKEYRMQKNYSIIELAETLDVSISELSEMERGKRPLSKRVVQWMNE